MSKHRLSPAPLPAAKRQHKITEKSVLSVPLLNFDASLYDELVLVIFSYLSWIDLCTIQPTNRLWARLASDNQLWKTQFIREYGRLRLRGSRGFVSKHDGREIKPLPHTRKLDVDDTDSDNIDWKWMFRISSNWRRGRCQLERFNDPLDLASSHASRNAVHRCALLTGQLAITTSTEPLVSPHVYLHKRGTVPYILKGKHREQTPSQVTSLALDQSPPSSYTHKPRMAVFYDTGEFSVFLVDHNEPQHSRLLLTYYPRGKSDRTAPIRQAVYHHPLLVTLSHSFKLSLYDLSDGGVVHSQTLTSFSSYPPTSMVLTSGPKSYRLVLVYSTPVYPLHWSAAVTVLTISSAQPGLSQDDEDELVPKSCTVMATRTVRAFDVPSGWIDDTALRTIRDQWGRRAARVADVQTDGKWVVLAPADRLPLPPSSSAFASSSSSRSRTRVGTTACVLQLYRLHIPIYSSASSSNGLRLTFVRNLHGHTGPVVALSLADGRCVSRGADGSLWVWDLERGWGVEAQTALLDPALYPGLVSGPSRSFSDPRSTSVVDGASSESEDDDEKAIGNGTLNDEVPMGTPLGAVVFDERRIVTADAYGVEMRRFDI